MGLIFTVNFVCQIINSTMFKSLVVATAIASVAGTKIVEEDHKVKALNPKMIEEINVSVTCPL